MQEFIAYFITILSFAGIVAVILQHFMQCFEQAEQENNEIQDSSTEAADKLIAARNYFNNADSDYIEAAVYEIKAAEAAVGAELKQKRRNAANGNVRI